MGGSVPQVPLSACLPASLLGGTKKTSHLDHQPGNFKPPPGPGQGQRVPILLKLLFFTKINESRFLRVLGVPLKSWMGASGKRHRRGASDLGDRLWALSPQGSHIIGSCHPSPEPAGKPHSLPAPPPSSRLPPPPSKSQRRESPSSRASYFLPLSPANSSHSGPQ